MEELNIEALPGVGPTPEKKEIDLKEYNVKQIEVARNMYQRMHDEASYKSATDDEILNFWIDAGYNDVFRHIVRSEAFAQHPKFAGEILNITPDDILSFVDPELREE